MRCWVLLVLLIYNAKMVAAANQTVIRVKRVVGGHISYVRNKPYLVNIRKGGIFHCGGTLLTSRCVLTAAHCLKHGRVQDYAVRGGVTYLKERRNERNVRRMLIPKMYNRNTLDHDIAILQLETPLKGKHIQNVQLAKHKPTPGSFVEVSGWGLTNQNSDHPSNQMRSVLVRVMAQQDCQQLYTGYRNITDAMFCASVPGYKDACSADSGGPALSSSGLLIGVVSWGKSTKCAQADAPGVYVSIPSVLYWIKKTKRRFCY